MTKNREQHEAELREKGIRQQRRSRGGRKGEKFTEILIRKKARRRGR